METRVIRMLNNLPSELANNIQDVDNEINAERGMIPGGDAVWNADGQVSQEKKRGAILNKRLNLINEFLVMGQGTDIPFGVMLKRKGLTEKQFLSELPSTLQFVGISNETPSSRRLLSYGVAMNKEYETQYLTHIINTADGELSCDGCSGSCSSADGAGAAAVACNLKYPPPRLTSKRKDQYNDCLRTQAVKIIEKREVKAEAKQDKKDEKKAAGVNGLASISGVVNKTNPVFVLIRNGFLGLTRLNALNLAKNLSQIKSTGGDHWNKVVKKWVILGGDLNSIKSAIDAGKGKKPIFVKKKVGADGQWESAEGDIAMLAGLTAAVTAVGGPPAGAWAASASGTIAAFLPIIDSYKKLRGEKLTEEENINLPSGINDEVDGVLAEVDMEKVTAPIQGSFMDQYKYWVIGAMVLLSGLTVLALTSSNPKGKLAV